MRKPLPRQRRKRLRRWLGGCFHNAWTAGHRSTSLLESLQSHLAFASVGYGYSSNTLCPSMSFSLFLLYCCCDPCWLSVSSCPSRKLRPLPPCLLCECVSRNPYRSASPKPQALLLKPRIKAGPGFKTPQSPRRDCRQFLFLLYFPRSAALVQYGQRFKMSMGTWRLSRAATPGTQPQLNN